MEVKGSSLAAHLVILHPRWENVLRCSSLHALFKLHQPERFRFQEVGEPLSYLVTTIPALNVQTENPGAGTRKTKVTSCTDRSRGRRSGWGLRLFVPNTHQDA